MVLNIAKAILKPNNTALLICDMQTGFAKAMYEFDKIIENTSKLVNALNILQVPILVTEQNPKSLGPTISQLNIRNAKGPFPKTQFSMCTPEVCQELCTICDGGPPESIILAGIEAHVCIECSVIDLRNDGYEVHIVADCCTSRSQEDRLLALQRMRDMGCHVSTSESIIFKLLGDAKNKDFKKIREFIKTPSLDTQLVTLSKL